MRTVLLVASASLLDVAVSCNSFAADKPKEMQVEVVDERHDPLDRYTDILNEVREGRRRGTVLAKPEFNTQETTSSAGQQGSGPKAGQVEKYDAYPAIPGREPLYPIDRVVFPEDIVISRNVMDPIPVQNNLQLYPFTMPLAMEGSRLLRQKQIEIHAHNTYVQGNISGQNSMYKLSMDQWYSVQTFAVDYGLHEHINFKFSIPLYHFNGSTQFTQNGVEMIGLGSTTRHFWGGAMAGLKTRLIDSEAYHIKSRLSLWFQFPEGNQRANGGVDSGHWALNSIVEKYWGTWRATANFGYVQAGDINLLNNTRLRQSDGLFAGLALSRNIIPTLALEGQLHFNRSTLDETRLEPFVHMQTYGALGLRASVRQFDLSLAGLAGADDFPEFGITSDLCYRF